MQKAWGGSIGFGFKQKGGTKKKKEKEKKKKKISRCVGGDGIILCVVCTKIIICKFTHG
jgi:hypothetical protein